MPCLLSVCLLLLPLLAMAQPQVPDTLWTYTYAGPYRDEAYAIQPTSDGGFVLGGQTWVTDRLGYACLIHLDHEGREVWVRTYPAVFLIKAIAPMTDGGWALAGTAGPLCNMAVIRTDSLGEERWSRCLNGGGLEKPASILATADGGLVVLSEGRYGNIPDIDLVRLSAAGDSLWTRTYGVPDENHGGALLATDDGGFLIAGSSGSQAVLIRTDSVGNELWSSRFGETGMHERLFAVCQTPSGDLVGAGWQNTASRYDPYAACVSPSGDTLWTRAFASLGPGWFSSACALPDGNTVLAGRGSFDYLVVLLTPSGDTLWTTHYGGPDYDTQQAMCLTEAWGLAIAGFQHTGASQSANVWVVRTESLYPEAIESVNYLQSFGLLKAYPNPFNAQTRLAFELPRAGRAEITLYDLGGRAVHTLTDHVYDAGRHDIAVNADALPSGLYFARLTTPGFTQTQKLLLIK